MTTQDYKEAAKKLKRFVHDSKMFRDQEYRAFYEITEYWHKLLEDTIWGCSIPLYGSDDIPIALGFFPLIK